MNTTTTMLRTVFRIATASLVLLATGCTGLMNKTGLVRPNLGPNELYAQSLLETYSDDRAVHDFIAKGDLLYHYVKIDAKGKKYRETGWVHYPNDRQLCRNKVMRDLLFLLNYYYAKYELTWYAGTAGSSFLADSTTLTLDTLSSVFTPLSTKTVLSTASTIVGGVKISAERDIFQKNNVAVLVHRMRTSRDLKISAVRAKYELPYDQYPIEEALLDLQDVFLAGTMLGAIQNIQDESGYQAMMAENLTTQAERAGRLAALVTKRDADVAAKKAAAAAPAANQAAPATKTVTVDTAKPAGKEDAQPSPSPTP